MTATSTGAKYAEQRYMPWGGARWSDNPLTPTARPTQTWGAYTGQIQDYYIKAGLLATADGVAGMAQRLQPLAQQLQTLAGQLFR